MYVTEIENFTKMMVDPSHKKLLTHSARVRNLVKRPLLIAEKLVDESSDPIYRNGLRCFINKLCGSKTLLSKNRLIKVIFSCLFHVVVV